MRFLLIVVTLLCASVVSRFACAEDLVSTRAYFEDKTGKHTISEVVEKNSPQSGRHSTRGSLVQPHWLRLTVSKPETGNNAILLIRQPYLDEISLFEAAPQEPTGWKQRNTGASYPFESRERLGKNLAFPVTITQPEATFYLRLRTTSLTQATVEALEPSRAISRVHDYDLLNVFFSTSMAALLAWALHGFWTQREKVIALFAFHQAAFILYGISVTGYLAPYLPGDSHLYSGVSTILPYCLVSFTTLLFCRTLFVPYNPPRLLMRGIDLLLLFFPVQVAAVVLGYYEIASYSNFVLFGFPGGT